jgi:hypothetical protein
MHCKREEPVADAKRLSTKSRPGVDPEAEITTPMANTDF